MWERVGFLEPANDLRNTDTELFAIFGLITEPVSLRDPSSRNFNTQRLSCPARKYAFAVSFVSSRKSLRVIKALSAESVRWIAFNSAAVRSSISVACVTSAS